MNQDRRQAPSAAEQGSEGFFPPISEWDGLRYFDDGEGLPILLVNGLFQQIETWQPIVGELRRKHRVLCVEFPNQAPSAARPHLRRLDAYSACLAEFLRYRGLDSADVVAFGISFGATVLRHSHLMDGAEYRSLVLSGGFMPRNRLNVQRIYDLWQTALDASGIELFAKTVATTILSAAAYERMPRIQRVMERRFPKLYGDDEQRLHALVEVVRSYVADPPAPPSADERYRCPVHLVAGREDWLVPEWAAAEYARTIAAASYQVVPGGHFHLVDDTSYVTRLIDDVAEARRRIQGFHSGAIETPSGRNVPAVGAIHE